jgi:hypothetical protein
LDSDLTKKTYWTITYDCKIIWLWPCNNTIIGQWL